MNFFERQHQVRRISHRLVLLFLTAVLGLVLLVNLIALTAFDVWSAPAADLFTAIIVISAITIAIIGLTSLVRMASLKNGGGGAVARKLGGVYVPEDTRDPQLRRLRNVVEEMAIASGVGVPEVYVLAQEDGINAFAAGWSPSDSAVAVTRGALERLNRDELQGVIAHEFSHVINGDMRLNIRLMGVLFGIMALAVAARIGLYSARGRNAAPILMVALGALIVGYIGVLMGRLIKAAVSRQREYLADASAVQYTRQTEGLTGALKKIGGIDEGSKLRDGHVEDVSHMLFGEGMNFSNAFATHPPLHERIKTLDPSFDPAELDELSKRWSSTPPSGMQEDKAKGLAEGLASGAAPAEQEPGGQGTRAAQGHQVPVQSRDVVAGVGSPEAASYQQAGEILRRIPEELMNGARDHERVVPVVFGLLFSEQQDVRTRQYHALAGKHGQQMADAAWSEAQGLAQLDPGLRLPLLEVAFSALRNRHRNELNPIMDSAAELIGADGRLSMFEYCLGTLLHRELYEAIHHSSPWRAPRRHTLAGNAEPIAKLLAVLARAGQVDDQAAEAAYLAGMARLLPNARVPFGLPEKGLVELDASWPALDGLDSREKQYVVASMVDVISHDGVVTVEEAELLRTVCALLHCPLPPLEGVHGPGTGGVPTT
ncbi:M48 family metallopeptidase [Haloechinothrix sp. YIM 98757]|uniref:M48 family metallopeptidase n=1 Tax=Haloechinothrix aidingensis TaxID=2752311 RepID=A0A838A8U7_9PSEU|nr:M48 family metallopeptidase [Haloechinothrix aidingensis]MBA0125925.1 M48 family metallopeptidase [Haloechinothrix aidingensis]